MEFNWKKYKAIQKKHDLEFKDIPTTPGIYLWTRYKADVNKTCCYVGQAKNLRNRHFNYYAVIKGITYPKKHFEASLKAHDDWKYQIIENCFEGKLDEREKYWIDYYAKLDNYISYNVNETSADRTQSNKNRIAKIENKIRSEFRHSMSRLDRNLDDKEKVLTFSVKRNKDNTFNQNSLNAFDNLIEFLKELVDLNNKE